MPRHVNRQFANVGYKKGQTSAIKLIKYADFNFYLIVRLVLS
jgi:hypothetical protein